MILLSYPYIFINNKRVGIRNFKDITKKYYYNTLKNNRFKRKNYE